MDIVFLIVLYFLYSVYVLHVIDLSNCELDDTIRGDDFIEDPHVDLVPSTELLKSGEVPYWSYPDNYTLSDLSQWFPETFFQLEDPA